MFFELSLLLILLAALGVINLSLIQCVLLFVLAAILQIVIFAFRRIFLSVLARKELLRAVENHPMNGQDFTNAVLSMIFWRL